MIWNRSWVNLRFVVLNDLDVECDLYQKTLKDLNRPIPEVQQFSLYDGNVLFTVIPCFRS